MAVPTEISVVSRLPTGNVIHELEGCWTQVVSDSGPGFRRVPVAFPCVAMWENPHPQIQMDSNVTS